MRNQCPSVRDRFGTLRYRVGKHLQSVLDERMRDNKDLMIFTQTHVYTIELSREARITACQSIISHQVARDLITPILLQEHTHTSTARIPHQVWQP